MTVEDPERVAVVLPAYNEAPVVRHVVQGVREYGYRAVVVDDGSTDATADEAAAADALVLRHRINRGKGAAVGTGIAAAVQLAVDVVVTMDADGQHDPAEIDRLVGTLDTDARVGAVLGVRALGDGAAPSSRRWANHVANLLVRGLYGFRVADSQCGFRAYAREVLETLEVNADRFEFDAEILAALRRRGVRWVEVPISVHYTPYSLRKPEAQNIFTGLRTALRLFWHSIL